MAITKNISNPEIRCRIEYEEKIKSGKNHVKLDAIVRTNNLTKDGSIKVEPENEIQAQSITSKVLSQKSQTFGTFRIEYNSTKPCSKANITVDTGDNKRDEFAVFLPNIENVRVSELICNNTFDQTEIDTIKEQYGPNVPGAFHAFGNDAKYYLDFETYVKMMGVFSQLDGKYSMRMRRSRYQFFANRICRKNDLKYRIDDAETLTEYVNIYNNINSLELIDKVHILVEYMIDSDPSEGTLSHAEILNKFEDVVNINSVNQYIRNNIPKKYNHRDYWYDSDLVESIGEVVEYVTNQNISYNSVSDLHAIINKFNNNTGEGRSTKPEEKNRRVVPSVAAALNKATVDKSPSKESNTPTSEQSSNKSTQYEGKQNKDELHNTNELKISPRKTPRTSSTRTTQTRDYSISAKLKKKYDNSCAICGQCIESPAKTRGYSVEAAHIYPAKEGGPDEMMNLVALCPLHHWGLDNGWFDITQDYTVRVANRPKIDGYEKFIHYDGDTLSLPEDTSVRPDQKWLRLRSKLSGFSKFHEEDVFPVKVATVTNSVMERQFGLKKRLHLDFGDNPGDLSDYILAKVYRIENHILYANPIGFSDIVDNIEEYHSKKHSDSVSSESSNQDNSTSFEKNPKSVSQDTSYAYGAREVFSNNHTNSLSHLITNRKK